MGDAGLSPLLAGPLPMLFLMWNILVIVPAWRLCRRAGHAPGWSLLVLIPLWGPLVMALVLAIRKWQPRPSGPEGGSHV